MIKRMHEQARSQIEAQNAKYAFKANKGRKSLTFEKGGLVWVHLRKERFPNQRKSKLQPTIDGAFRVEEKINDNAYKIDLQGKYGAISNTFNASDLSPFHDADLNSRTNSFKEGEDDEDIMVDLEALQFKGAITRSRAKALQALIMEQEALTHSVNTIESQLECFTILQLYI